MQIKRYLCSPIKDFVENIRAETAFSLSPNPLSLKQCTRRVDCLPAHVMETWALVVSTSSSTLAGMVSVVSKSAPLLYEYRKQVGK